MKVVLLNAGIGKRLSPLTNSKPKCLVRINNNDTILDHQIKNIIKFNFKEFIIPTGPFENQIKAHIKKFYPSIDVQFIHNPRYETTNYIYSVYLARDVISDDVLISHGDLIISENLIELILESSDKDCVLVNKEIPPPVKDFKANILNNRIYKIGVNISGPQTAFLAPFYKLSKKFMRQWLKQIEIFVNNDKLNCYAEDALNEILDKIVLKPCFFNEFCIEIDDLEDLEKAKQYFKKNN